MPFGAGPGQARVARAGHRQAVVGLAVAVVVKAVADLVAWLAEAEADERAVATECMPVRADAPLAGVTAAFAAWVALVDQPIAIVVHAVADLEAGLDERGANERPVQALHDRVLADAVAAVAGGQSTLGVVIDGPVTVIVRAIADLGAGVVLGIAGELSREAAQHARRAVAGQAAVADRATARLTLIHLPIAVIVRAVADLRAHGEARVAGIAQAIAVSVFLVWIRIGRAVVAGVATTVAVLVGTGSEGVRGVRAEVAGVALPVAVPVGLVGVGHRLAVVVFAAILAARTLDPIAVQVYADPA